MRRGARNAWIFAAAAVAVAALANLAADRWRPQGREPPEYGTWSGVLEAERKIRLLGQYARGGEVDALILSSSMGDLGVSAEVLTREMTARLGRPYRVFNFSMGGADIGTYALLYRLARLAARAREVWIVTPVSNPSQEIRRGSLDEKLIEGPVGRYSRVPGMLPLAYAFFQVPLVRNAPALRDAGMHLRFANRPASNLDIYDIDAAGDTVSWLYNVNQYELGDKLLIDRRRELARFAPTAADPDARGQLAKALPPRALAALEELRASAAADGAALKVIPFDMAYALTMHDAEYLGASRPFYEALSHRLGAPVVDVRASMRVEPYMISDAVHFNAIGAAAFSRLLAARLAGAADAQPGEPAAAPEIVRARLPDAKWTPFTPLILRARGEPTACLYLSYLQNWGVRTLSPRTNVEVLLRRARGGEDLVPARLVAPGEVAVDTSGLAFDPGSEVMIAQLLYRNGTASDKVDLPLARYRWSAERPAVDFAEFRTQAHVRSDKALYSALEPLRAHFDGVDDPTPTDYVAVQREGPGGGARVSSVRTGGKSSGSVEIPPLMAAGRYRFRVYRRDGPEMVAASEPFEVAAMTGRITVRDTVLRSDQALAVSWREVRFPHPRDWIGLFRRDAGTDVYAMKHTGGAPQGSLEIPLSSAVPPGEYEVRFYSSGVWTVMDTVAVRVEAAR